MHGRKHMALRFLKNKEHAMREATRAHRISTLSKFVVIAGFLGFFVKQQMKLLEKEGSNHATELKKLVPRFVADGVPLLFRKVSEVVHGTCVESECAAHEYAENWQCKNGDLGNTPQVNQHVRCGNLSADQS